MGTNPGTDPSVVPMTSATVSCTSTVGGTLIATVSEDFAPVILTNAATATVYLGDQGVTTATGYALAPSTSVMVTYGPPAPNFGGVSCALYGIVASTASVVTYLTATSWPGPANLPAE
jgi:hypothetical protein